MKTLATTCLEKPAAGRRRLLACVLSALLIASGGLALAQSGSTPKFREYEVKAAFLFNFMQFVEWPSGASTNAEVPLLIGVLGEDPFGPLLEKTIKGESLNGHPLSIKRSRRIADLNDCHLVFVCRSEATHLAEILDAMRAHSVLTVSDIDQFCRHGGMIGLINEGGRVRFEINQGVAEQGGLRISAKLLRLGCRME